MKVKRITRALSLFLVCVMLASILPLGAYAEYYSDTYRVPKAYIKDLKITTDMAEVCQTGNLARSVEAQLEGAIEDKNGGDPFLSVLVESVGADFLHSVLARSRFGRQDTKEIDQQ